MMLSAPVNAQSGPRGHVLVLGEEDELREAAPCPRIRAESLSPLEVDERIVEEQRVALASETEVANSESE